MSKVPANARTKPPQRRWPSAASTAAPNVSATPMTVIWLGVIGMRPTADINASARRRTQVSNRVVNIHLLELSCGGVDPAQGHCYRLVVDLDDLRRHDVPPKAAGFLVPVGAHAAPEVGVPRKDDQRRTELGPTLWLHGHAVATRLEDRHVSFHLGRHHGQARG